MCDNVWKRYIELKEILGNETILDAIEVYLSMDQIQELIERIEKDYDTNYFNL